MKKLVVVLMLIASMSCTKKGTPTPTVTHSNDAALIGSWSVRLPGKFVHGASNILTFTTDSMNYRSSAPIYAASSQFNASYTQHDTLFISTLPAYTWKITDSKLYLTSISGISAGYLTKQDTTTQPIIITNP